MQTIIVQILIFQLCFLVVYELLLRKETFFNWNRAYLLITSIVSLVVPFIKLKSFSKVIPNEFIISLPTVILGESTPENPVVFEQIESVIVNNESALSMLWIWYAGIVVFTGILLFKLAKIWKFKLMNSSVEKQGYSITTLKNSEDAFSFLQSIFLGDQIENTQKESILTHEKVHVKEKHTIDLLWFELLRIVLWFNPLIYIYQKRITEVHEFIADKSASKDQQNYYENLLAKTFNIAQFSVVNQFYSASLIKKRIIMLTKEKSNKTKLVKYITVIPIVLVMLVFVSFTDALEAQNITGTTVSSETTVMKDVLRIVNETYDLNTNFSTKEERAAFNKEMTKYYKANETTIENLGFNKYAQYYAVRDIVGLPIKDLLLFVSVESSIASILDQTKHQMGTHALMIRNKKIYARLHELNFKLPNEDLYKQAYEKAIQNGMKEVTNSVQHDVNGELIVSFKYLDKAPIYPGCDENATSEELKECFSRSISIHINENFNTNIAEIHNLIGRQKIFIRFMIDENGELKEVNARGPHEALVAEAKRAIHTLPALKPGMHNGKAVTVAYSIPVIFMNNK